MCRAPHVAANDATLQASAVGVVAIVDAARVKLHRSH